MSNFKHIFKLFLLLSLAFLAGYLYNSFYKNETLENKKAPIFFQTNQKENIKQENQTKNDQKIKQKRQNAFENYFIYKRQTGENLSFKEFLNLKKDVLIQENMYNKEKEEEYKTIAGSVKNNETTNKLSFYTVNGQIDNFKEICSKKDIEKVIVATFLIKPELKYNPLVPKKSIYTEQAISKKEIQCKKDFHFKINSLYENVPTYTVLYAFRKNSIKPSYYGIDKETFGIPISLLSKREKNNIIEINFKKIKKEEESLINLFIYDSEDKPLKNIMVSLCGINEISNKFLDYSLFKTVFSDSKGVARLKRVPYYSTVCLEIKDNDNRYKTVRFNTFTKNHLMEIELSLKEKETDSNLTIINNGFFNELNVLDSGSDYAKKTHSHNSFSIINIKGLPYQKELLLDFSYNNQTIGLLTKTTKEEERTVIEPRYIFFNYIYGSIKTKEKCSVSIENTGKKFYGNNFYFSDVSLLKETNNIIVSCSNYKLIMPLFLNSLNENIKLDLEIPKKELVNYIKNTYPSTPNNGSVLIKSDICNFFIFGLESKEILKPKQTNGFFVFNNLKPGKYLIYKLKDKKIKKIKSIKVKESYLTFINI